MNNQLDSNNIFLAALSSLPTMIAALETQTWITITSAIILPLFFFAIGKTVDVLLQLYLRDREEKRRHHDDEDE